MPFVIHKPGISFLLLCLFVCSTGKFSWAQTLENPTVEPWWKKAVFYEIYMPSFADSNGDGYGDFKGMTAKLDYLQSLGIRGIWLTPFLLSPKVDNGYDVADYYQVDPIYGNLTDFKTYLKEAHKRGIKVIMDMVLNHTSTESKWFIESRKSVSNPYRNYYIWKEKPNNWESFFGGSAWRFDTLSNQYYYHKFDTRMADLNWSNPKVVEEMHRVLRYWLNLGVDGFRLDVINFLTTDGITSDNPLKDGQQQHANDIDQPRVIAAINGIRSLLNEYPHRFIVGEVGSDKIDILKKYQSPTMLDVVFNFNLGSIATFNSKQVFDELKSMENNLSGYPTLFFGSHDMPRLMDRLANADPERAMALAAILLTAKGVPFIYYGDEIGMQNVTADSVGEIADIQGKTRYDLTFDTTHDAAFALAEANKNNRDKSRSPMQWNGNVFAGFSASKSWLKINSNKQQVNVAVLASTENSILNRYKKLIAIRNRERVLQFGNYESMVYGDDQIMYTRTFAGERITTVINFGSVKKVTLPHGSRILDGSTTLLANRFIIYKH